MSSADRLTSMLIIVLMILVFILLVLGAVYLVMRMKANKKQEGDGINVNKKDEKSDAKKIAKEYTKDSIFKFMEFDKIEDNMIVQKGGNRYLMVIECQGVNYDLMSEAEKVSVEEGFLQFLNTLRHPIQIYVQTRTVNLNDSIENYKNKLQVVEMELEKKKNEYLRKVQDGGYTKEQLEREFYEVTKQTNLYEYGKDIIENTQRMSLNKNVLNKKYYVIVPYSPDDLGGGAFDKEEIKNLAFSELYTKAQSIVRTLSTCEINGKILTSTELVELLYVAYNRDEAEVFSVDRAVRAGYEELYTTAPDVMDKRIKILDEEIEKKALQMVNEKVLQVRSKKQQQVEQKQNNFGDLIRKRAEMILQQNSTYIGEDTAKEAIELVKDENKTKKNNNSKEKGGDTNVGQKAKKSNRGRKPKATE